MLSVIVVHERQGELLQLVILTPSCAYADPAAQQANSPAVGRHLNFTPGTGNTRTAENSNRNSNNQLPLAALPGNEAMVQTGNSHMPVQAKTSSGTPSNESQGLSMGGISNITNKVREYCCRIISDACTGQ